MLTETERARVLLLLNRALHTPTHPETDTDTRKMGLALAVSRWAGTPELAKIIAVADAIEDETGGASATFETPHVMGVTGLDRPQCEAALMCIGARQQSVLVWSVGDNGDVLTLPENLMGQWAEHNF